jgi:L,D-transpeptidase YcbB
MAAAQHGGRLAGAKLPDDWRIRPAPYDARAELAAALAADRLASWLKEAPPPYEGYRRLLAALAQYRGFAASGGWSPLQVKLSLKPGDKGPDVPALRKRLIAEGYAVGEAGEDPSLYDDKLVQAVSIFQRLHGLADAGIIGRQTVEAFNVSAPARIATLEANLERWRWLPRALPATRVEVNTAAALVEVFADGQIKLAMRAIVGKPASPTPMLAEEIERVVFNPPWNVPAGIAAEEIIPKIRKDPGYMAKNDLVWVGSRLQQTPGDKAALGRLKFDMPNDLDIYLHDTPARTLFVNDERHLSHGCVRLQSPRDLAIFALAMAGVDGAGIDAAIATKITSRTALAQPLPVFLIYRTAFVDADGQVQFRKDAYHWDDRLLTMLGG